MRFDEEYLTHLHGGVSLDPELYVQPAMVLVGMNTRFFSVDSGKNNTRRARRGRRLVFVAGVGLGVLAEHRMIERVGID